MTRQTEALLLEAITACSARTTGAYGPCYCREPYPNKEQGHEDRCKTLARAIKASIAAVAGGSNPVQPTETPDA
jgi:hypothetical protein